MRLIATLFCLTLTLVATNPATAREDDTCRAGLVMEEVMIASDTPGISLYLRNKRPPCTEAGQPRRAVLFVHGATYPAETSFDLGLDGMSWMDFIARHGWDVWLVDLRGYGRSTRPPEMELPAADHAPIVTTDVAVRDVRAAVAFVRARTGIDRVALIGWSWGTTIMGAYAATYPAEVSKLVLYAPVWLRTTPSPLAGTGPLPAYRTVTKDSARQRWLRGVPEDKVASLIPPGWFEAWADATWATDPRSAGSGLLRAPNGVLHDIRAFWLSDRPYYDPAKITAPTLLAVAEWDQDTPPYMAQTLFGLLSGTASKRLVMFGEGTHTIIMERNRMDLIRSVQEFLDEPDR